MQILLLVSLYKAMHAAASRIAWSGRLAAASLICAFLQLAVSPASAVGVDQSLAQLNHTAWTTREGAPANIQALAQTPDGLLWIGSSSGLFHFDGVSFERFAPNSGEAPLTEDICALFTEPNGDLWIGGRFGSAHRLHQGHLTSFGVAQGLPNHTLFSFVRDGDGQIWATTSFAIFVLKNGRWLQNPLDLKQKGAFFGKMTVDRDGTLWVISTVGMFYLRRGGSAFLPGPVINGIPYLDRDGNAWAPDYPLHSKNPIQFSNITTSKENFELPKINGISNPDAAIYLFDREGMVWIVSGENLARIPLASLITARNAGRHPVDAPGMALAHWASGTTMTGPVFEDRENNVWLGTNGGLDRFRDNKFTAVESPLQLDNAALAPTMESGIWAGTDAHGLIRVNSSVEAMHVLDGFGTHNGILAIHQGADGVLWVGGRSELWRSSQSGYARVALPFNEPVVSIQAIATDAAGGVWVSTVGQGLWRLHGQAWTPNGGLKGLPDKVALTIATDPSGNLWFGYQNDQVARVTRDTVTTFGRVDGIAIGNVTSIHASADRVWFGGARGVAYFRADHFRMLRPVLPGALLGVSGIAASSDGALWFNGTAGVARLAESEIDALSSDPAYSPRVELMTALDGLDGTPQQLRPLETAVRSTDGRIWIATSHGLYWIDPARILRNTLAPAVFVRSINTGDVHRAAVDGLELPQGTQSLDIDYTATSLKIPERVLFRYRLEGVDATWQDADTRRRAWYTNLRPGAYRFRVIASNEDGVWNTDGATLSFSIAAAFYQTLWFRFFCGLIVLAGLFALLRLRLRQVSTRLRLQIEARAIERERIARELHDTLLQGTQGLVLSFQVIADRLPSGDTTRRDMEAALDQADEVIAQARDSVLDLRTTASSAEDLPQRLQSVVAELSTEGDVSAALEVIGHVRLLSMEVREEAYRIAREALLNSFRHSRARHIVARLTYDRKTFELQVSDDGLGIDQEILASGARPGHWGLIGMRERAARIGGRFTLKSVDNEGTVIGLTVSAGRAYASTRTGSVADRLSRWLGLKPRRTL